MCMCTTLPVATFSGLEGRSFICSNNETFPGRTEGVKNELVVKLGEGLYLYRKKSFTTDILPVKPL